MVYRDDKQAANDKLRALEVRLVELRRTQASAHEQLAGEQALFAELAALRAQLAPSAAELKKRLPLVQQVYVAAPCPASWDAMQGDHKSRFCDECKRYVHNLSAMTDAEANKLLSHAAPGSLCVRLYRRADGTVLTQDCAVGLRRRNRGRLTVVAAVSALGLAALANLALKANQPAQWQEPCPQQHTVEGGLGGNAH